MSGMDYYLLWRGLPWKGDCLPALLGIKRVKRGTEEDGEKEILCERERHTQKNCKNPNDFS